MHLKCYITYCMIFIMGDTFEEVKDEVKHAAKKITDSDTYLGDRNEENRDNPAGGKEPMNPEDVAEHEPTAVKRDKNQGTSGDPL